MVKKLSVLTVLTVLNIGLTFAQTHETKKESLIQWMDIETAVEKQKEIPKPIFVDMYTDWCGWCKKLDAETFANPNIAAYLNANFYPVKFDAETLDTIEYMGETYVNNSTGRRPTHQLALKLLDNRPSYPSMVYIDEKGNSNRTAGFMDAVKIEPILIFFAERIHNTTNYPAYNEAFNTLYRPQDTSAKLDVSGKINWLSLEEAVQEQAVQPKKLMIFIWSQYYQKISSSLMKDVTLTNPHIADYLNENYYCVSFEASSTDTIHMFNQTFVNEQKQPGYPHQFVISILNQRLIFPSIVFFNEANEMLSPMQGYFTPSIMEPYLHFVYEDKYKEGNWQTYYQNFEGKVERPKIPGQ